uniref:Uncharacterized protein n=1 Tax=Vitis vinifera TaxID=29760 RepID=F6I2N3_VITVI
MELVNKVYEEDEILVEAIKDVPSK